MSDLKLLPCPFCGKEIDMEENMYIPERDWKPTFYDPDSGGDPINIHCKCGLEFSTGTYDYIEFVNAWNTRKPMDRIVEQLEEESEVSYKDWQRFDEESSFGAMNAYSRAIEIVKAGGNNGIASNNQA